MKLVTICLLMLFAAVAHAEGQRVYQRDTQGNIMYNKPSYAVQKDGRIIEMDPIGNIQYNKPGFVVK